jgi:hypothetical protein
MLGHDPTELLSRFPSLERRDPLSKFGFPELVLVQDREVPCRIHPNVEKQVGGLPGPPVFQYGRSQDVGINPRERTVGPVKTADVVPGSGEGEPDRIGARLEYHLPMDSKWWIEMNAPSQRHLHVRAIKEESLGVDLPTSRGPEIMDVNQIRVGLH